MYKLKEFQDNYINEVNGITVIKATKQVNEFIDKNNIKDYQVVGYSTFGASRNNGNVQECTSILIKYLEDE
ncbi:hypothetical protein [Staphylococcus pettenkoferi]|uniref:hypothetical protein n=1 Tax=Staphylococcus pettenkoferi TaxID=170573 RepID=UPI001F55C710|nr:hypothetical protein [Staphylococcus pettenkoferi]MCI2802339.1 hypothetical protein [Staphylococcus pettenkoferi]MCY1596605.1 hypothetical protein [Staphylococcus pettenkoferi]MCY1608053.1 hypothetical protein [Staphylococcus pettenkoferi]